MQGSRRQLGACWGPAGGFGLNENAWRRDAQPRVTLTLSLQRNQSSRTQFTNPPLRGSRLLSAGSSESVRFARWIYCGRVG